MPEIQVYTQPMCPYCARVVRLLTEKGVPFQEINAPGGSPARAEAKERSGGSSTVPQVFIDGRHVGGCDETLAMDRQGKLDPLLQAA